MSFTSKHFLLLIFLIPLNTLGQVIFEKGYFIDNGNDTINCLVKNYDWKNSPTNIEYRLTNSAETRTASIADVKEFKVSNLKFRRFTVQIDQSRNELNSISREKEPVFSEETLFLKLIIEGAANLYVAGKYQRYFFNVNDSAVKQLIHKNYLVNDLIMSNNSYKSQLWEGLKCSCIKVQDIESTKYTEDDLIKLFEKYNTCVGSNFINYKKNRKKVEFNLGIKPGLRLAKVSIRNPLNSTFNVDYDSDLSFSFGIDAELVFPINKNKWALFFEPTFQYYKAKAPQPNYSNSVDYKSIELPIGIKYNIFLPGKSKIFLTAGVVIIDIPINSNIGMLEISTSHNYNFGFGYCYNNKFNVELRYGTARRLLGNYAYYSSSYQSLSLVFGYTVF
jgi:hypothetical protein